MDKVITEDILEKDNIKRFIMISKLYFILDEPFKPEIPTQPDKIHT